MSSKGFAGYAGGVYIDVAYHDSDFDFVVECPWVTSEDGGLSRRANAGFTMTQGSAKALAKEILAGLKACQRQAKEKK